VHAAKTELERAHAARKAGTMGTKTVQAAICKATDYRAAHVNYIDYWVGI